MWAVDRHGPDETARAASCVVHLRRRSIRGPLRAGVFPFHGRRIRTHGRRARGLSRRRGRGHACAIRRRLSHLARSPARHRPAAGSRRSARCGRDRRGDRRRRGPSFRSAVPSFPRRLLSPGQLSLRPGDEQPAPAVSGVVLAGHNGRRGSVVHRARAPCRPDIPERPPAAVEHIHSRRMKRVLLIEDLPQVAQHLQQMLSREKEAELVAVESESDAALVRVTTEKPDAVLIDALLSGKSTGFDIAKRVRAASPGTRIVMVTVPQRPIDPKPDQGIDAVFVLPGGANELATALAIGKRDVRLKGRMIVCFSPKGGSGKTTIAINLATILRRRGHSVALMDGVMQFGSVRHVLAVPPATRSIVDLPTGQGMRTSLSEVLWEGPSGVAVLLGPPRPEEAELMAAPDVATAMMLPAEDPDYVIVDAPSKLGEESLAVLDAADVILLVVTDLQASVANTRAAVDTFEALGYKGRIPILLVVNQADNAAGMSKGGIEHTLNLPVVGEIPTDWKLVAEALNKQQPFVLSSPNAAVSEAIDALANALVQQQRR